MFPKSFPRSPQITRLIYDEVPINVPTGCLIGTCSLFNSSEVSFASDYVIQSSVLRDALIPFTEAIQGKPIPITAQNFADLLKLSQEFGFSRLRDRIISFQQSVCASLTDDDPVSVLNHLEEKVFNQSRQIVHWEAEFQLFSQFRSDFETFKRTTTEKFSKTQSEFEIVKREINNCE
jgi:hypothetical protein